MGVIVSAYSANSSSRGLNAQRRRHGRGSIKVHSWTCASVGLARLDLCLSKKSFKSKMIAKFLADSARVIDDLSVSVDLAVKA